MLKSISQGTYMKIFANTPNGVFIALIIVGSIIVVAGIVFLLFKLIFEKNQLRRQIRDLDRRFQYLHALLIGQDAQYVKRLEIIARSNLLYVDIHTRFLKRFKEVRDKYDAHAQSTINNLKDLSDDKKYKILKATLVDAKDSITMYENEVNSLNNALLQVVKPEEDCRQASLSLKERLRGIKQDYYSKQSDLQLMNESFEEIFKYIDSLFGDFENFVECAQYDDANLILPKIDKILLEMRNTMGELPNLCAMVITYIPDKISSLENAYEIMQQENYPTHHLCVNVAIKEMRGQVNSLTTRIKQFDIKGVADELNNIASRIEEFFTLFEEEKQARVVFEEENETTYQTVNTIERRFIKLCNTIPEVGKVYIINDEHQGKINSIQNDINKLGALKRSLDTFIHSSTKQPYSLLVGKMHELTDASNTVILAMDDFSKYLSSLKIDSESAYRLVFDFFYKTKLAEHKVNEMGMQIMNDKYAEEFDRVYELLNDVNSLLLVAPINVDKVNENVKELHDIENDIIDNGAIDQDRNMMTLAENAIVYANRDRHHLSDINDLVSQAETLFNSGDFEKSYRIAGDTLNKLHANDHDNK